MSKAVSLVPIFRNTTLYLPISTNALCRKAAVLPKRSTATFLLMVYQTRLLKFAHVLVNLNSGPNLSNSENSMSTGWKRGPTSYQRKSTVKVCAGFLIFLAVQRLRAALASYLISSYTFVRVKVTLSFVLTASLTSHQATVWPTLFCVNSYSLSPVCCAAMPTPQCIGLSMN